MPRDEVSVNLCMAARFLHAEGWSTRRIGRHFERQDKTIADHVRGDCPHPELIEPRTVDVPTGLELREEILAAGYDTQGEFADDIGVGQTAVSAWVTGKQEPRMQYRRKIRSALNGRREERGES